jgi:hypothetical protein
LSPIYETVKSGGVAAAGAEYIDAGGLMYLWHEL